VVNSQTKLAKGNFQNEKLQVITIGSRPVETLSQVKGITNRELHISYVPFIHAKQEPNYLHFQVNKSPNLNQISPGAAGCLIAHSKAWGIARESNSKCILILEDDAVLTKYGKSNLGNLLANFTSYNVNLLHLGHPLKAPLLPTPRKLFDLSLHVATKTIYESVILKFVQPKIARNQFPPSSHAYLISPTFADALYSIPLNFGMPIDVSIGALAQVKQHKIARVRTPLFLQSGRPSTFPERQDN